MGRAVICLVVLASLTGTAWSGTHKDTRWGFRIKVPKDWKNAAMSATEEWIAAKFIGDRALEPKKSEFWVREHPHIWVIGFPVARVDDRGAKIEKKGDKTTIEWKNPYKDYKDFVKRAMSLGGGYHFSKEETATIGDVEVLQYEIKVEKGAAAPFRIVTWVYQFEDVHFAIHCKILEDHYDKYKSTFRSTLKSFRRIEREKALPGSATTGKKIIKVEDESKLTPEELKKLRSDRFEQLLRKELDALPDGWYEVRSKHYVALANADRKFTKRALKHAEAVRKYLDKTFAGIGSDYIPMGIIRVFASREEEQAFQGGTNWMWGPGVEQVLVTQTVGGTDRAWEFEYLSSRLTSQYLSFKNSFLSDNMPYWFREGLKQHMRFARSKGTSVKIKPDEYDRQYIKDIIKGGKAVPLKEMFQKGEAQNMTLYQAGSVCSYLLTKGNRGKTKGAIQNYLRNLVGAIEEAEVEYKAKRDALKKEAEARAAAAAAESGAVVESEDEEGEEEGDSAAEAEFEKMKEAMKERSKAVLEQAFEKTFGSLSDKDWERLNRAWLKYAG